MGYAGPPSQKAAEVQTKYIIVDMYAKAVQGMKPEDAVKWAHERTGRRSTPDARSTATEIPHASGKNSK